jgi:isoquinoline 1-oxidoreductase beta subunit
LLYYDLPSTALEEALPKPKIYPPDAFVNIQSAGKIVIRVNRLEVGQGLHTALPMILDDELDADWLQVVPKLTSAADVHGDLLSNTQMVGGSGSIAHSFLHYRELGAKTRIMLVAVAHWQILPEQCRTTSSVVHGLSGQSLAYGDLAAEAARQPLPTTVQLKNPHEFHLVGKKVCRLDSRAKYDGSLKFGLDLDLPGIKIALVAQAPMFGGKVKNLDDKAERSMQGVSQVFEIPVSHGGTAVAVVADKF